MSLGLLSVIFDVVLMLNHELIEYQNLDISTKLLQIYERLGDFVNKCSVYQRDCLIIYSYFTF